MTSAEWPVRDIAQALGPLVPDFRVEVVDAIDSTNTELMRRARAGRCEPVLLAAERQTAGRGRLGRAWHSAAGAGTDNGPGDAGASLTFSLGLPLAPPDWSGLSLAVGVAVAEALDPARRVPVSLKWPNDLWVRDCKLGGILIETALPAGGPAGRYLVVGVGLNVGPRPAHGLGTPPAWVRQWQPDASAPELLHALAEPLVRAVLHFGGQGFAPFAARFAERDALRGREVRLSDGTVGRCEGVGPAGGLRLRTAQGPQTVTSAEVSVRPHAGGAQR